MTRIQVLSLMIGISIAQNSFAACEREAHEYTEWHQRCRDLTTAAHVACVAGAACVWITFGGSLAAPLALVPTAMNACRIRDEKDTNLTNCRKAEEAKVAEAAKEFQRLESRNKELIERIEILDKDIARQIEEENRKYDKLIANKIKEVEESGADLEHEETIAMLQSVIDRVELRRKNYLTISMPRYRKEMIVYALVPWFNSKYKYPKGYGLNELQAQGLI